MKKKHLITLLLAGTFVFCVSCMPTTTAPQLILVQAEQKQAASTPKPSNIEPSNNIYSKYPDWIQKEQKKNADIIGWIKIPNTQINYPVALTNDNDFYIGNDIDKKPSKSGAIFLDYRNANENERRHLIIYGHNMKNGTMFHDLNSFKLRDFFKTNNVFSLWIWGEERKYEIYSQFVTTVDIQYINTKFKDDSDFTSYFETLKTQSKFPVNFDFKGEDEILTLSTCTYEYTDSSRCVVQARRIA